MNAPTAPALVAACAGTAASPAVSAAANSNLDVANTAVCLVLRSRIRADEESLLSCLRKAENPSLRFDVRESEAFIAATENAEKFSGFYKYIIIYDLPSSLDFQKFASFIFQVAAPAAAIVLLHPRNQINTSSAETALLQKASRNFVYSGFIATPSLALPEALDFSGLNNIVQWVGAKPTWALGTFKLVHNKMPADSSADKPLELIDESSLIEEDMAYVPLGKDRSSCASRPRACANCTCGRKEREDFEARKEMLEKGQIRSACGSCYLGDAFRCAGCPYRGLPAFKQGEKVSLIEPSPSIAGDANLDKQRITIKNNKVVLTGVADDV